MTTQEEPASCKVVLPGLIAKSLQLEVDKGLSRLERKPLLVGFLANKVNLSWPPRFIGFPSLLPESRILQPGCMLTGPAKLAKKSEIIRASFVS